MSGEPALYNSLFFQHKVLVLVGAESYYGSWGILWSPFTNYSVAALIAIRAISILGCVSAAVINKDLLVAVNLIVHD